MVQHNPTTVSGDSAKFHVDVNGKSSLDPHIAQTVMEQVRVVAQERAKDLTLDSNVVLMGLDSLERMDIIARLEDIFFVHVPESVLAEIETCQEISLAIQTEQQSQQSDDGIPPECYVLEQMPEYVDLRRQLDAMAAAGVDDPFFTVHEAISSNVTRINGQELINYSGNNYLGMSGDPEVTKAAQEALERYGTSVSASRLVSGTRPIHNELEAEISEFIGAEDSITFTSGHSTNATVIGHLMGRADLILHDELVHNSIIGGALLSGATRRSFPHNDWQALDSILKQVRNQFRKVLVIIEGVYSMDGDFPDVPKFVEIKNRHKSWLLIDEAHSIGTMGVSGRGVSELFDIPSADVEVWMGTLSKALGACGGYVAGSTKMIEYIKFTCPGVIFTIGLSPPSAAAALTVIRRLKEDPSPVATLHARARYFLTLAKQRGFDVGPSKDTAIIPVILGNSIHAMQASRMMYQRGISVQPILHPAVNEEGARLRFFVNSLHTNEQLSQTIKTLAGVLDELGVKSATAR